LPGRRINQVWSYLCQRLENERALAHSGMRYDQPFLVDDGVAIQEEIEVQRSGCAGIGSGPSPRSLNIE
jgi:hypothetical protein